MTGSTETSAGIVRLGRVAGVFGVKGWIRLFSYTEPREAILDYRDCQLCQDGRWRSVRLAEGKRHGKTVIARLADVDDRETAERLIGADIGIRRDDMPDAGDDRYYWADLQGLTVVNKDGQTLGTVAYLLATGANDVLAVQGDSEILIPFVPDRYVTSVDLASGVIRVDWEWE